MKIKYSHVVWILLGSAIMGFGINYFNIANGLSEGGITGLALILNYVLGWSPGITSILINLPLLLIGWRFFGRESFVYALIGNVSLSGFLIGFERFSLPMKDPLLASLYAGAMVGIGVGIVFRSGGMTDGTDVIARITQKYTGWSIGRTLLITDAIILVLSLIYLDLNRAMYTLIALIVGARFIDLIQEDAYAAKAAMIITKDTEDISAQILFKMKRSVTILNAKGAYMNDNKDVIYCVFSRTETVKLKGIVKEIDPNALVIINEVHEVFGKGWGLQLKEEGKEKA